VVALRDNHAIESLPLQRGKLVCARGTTTSDANGLLK
jgi:hypothetical protein